jgi:hypothetical protein
VPANNGTFGFAETHGDAHLPDIYHFNSNGLGVEDGFPGIKVAVSQESPFTPSVPRIDGSESVNFDFGALSTELEDTSFMAWF